jgi:hypothetical protein
VVVCCPDEKESPPALAPVEPGVCPNWGAEAEKPPGAFIIDSLVYMCVLEKKRKLKINLSASVPKLKDGGVVILVQKNRSLRVKGGLGGSVRLRVSRSES